MRRGALGDRKTALVAGLLALTACLGEDESPLQPLDGRAGGLVLGRMVAIGDGFAAGVVDGAVSESGQVSSVPALLAGRIDPHGDFRQPLVADPGFTVGEDDGGRLILVERFPPTITRQPRGGPPLDPDLPRPYDNLAVPNALVSEILTARSSATSLSANLFFDLVLRDRGTVVDQASELDPALIFVWIGASDILPFIEAGGEPPALRGLPTDQTTFETRFEALVISLLDITDQVVLLNVPDITDLPVARAVPPIVINPETGEPATITILVPEIDPVTQDTILVGRRVPVPVLGPAGPLEPGERVTLRAGPLLQQGVGVPTSVGGTGLPLPSDVVLDLSELELARSAVAGYNTAIARLATEHGLVLVDVQALVEELSDEGIVSDGVRMTGDFVTGQAFGLDGAYFTSKGYGVVANRVIDALNQRYGGALPHIRTADLPGVSLLENP